MEVRHLNGQDEKEFLKTKEKRKKMGLPETNSTDLLKKIIVSVSGRSDRETINNVVDNMPIKLSSQLQRIYGFTAPAIDMVQSLSCSFCAAELEMEVPLSADFFWPK